MIQIAKALPKQFPPSLLSKLANIENEIYRHPLIEKLKERYPQKLDPNNPKKFTINQLDQYVKDSEFCSRCTGMSLCPNFLKGHRMVIQDDEILGPSFIHSPCDYQKSQSYQQQLQKYIKSHHVPDHVLRMTFGDLEPDNRMPVIKAVMKFCTSYEKGKDHHRGLYLYGPMGVGKSAICGAMTQELAKRQIDVLMVYVPDFLIEIKEAIKKGEVEEKLSAMKEVSVLILDDIGAEQITPWTRDEVIGPILQRRMERLPTIFTSNLTLKELKEHLQFAKGEVQPNVMKANRLMDRIEPFVEVHQVLGINRRRDNSQTNGRNERSTRRNGNIMGNEYKKSIGNLV